MNNDVALTDDDSSVISLEETRPLLPRTNGEAIRWGLVPCESNPKTGGLSYTYERFHGVATYTVGKVNPRKHVCNECRMAHFKYQPFKLGVLWG